MKGKWIMLLLAAWVASACDVSRKEVPSYPDSGSPDFQIYAQNCSECHAPPQPTAHAAIEWPNVIARMQLHRVQRSLAPIAAADVIVLRRYLEGHAARSTP